MRAVIVSAVFPPEPVVSSRTSFDVAQALAGRGHDVTVLAPFPNRPAGRLYPGFRRRLYTGQRWSEGFRVVRCFGLFSATSSMASRFAENVSFGITAAARLLFMGRPDVVYLNTWPVFATAFAVAVARLRKIPVIVSVQDIYPESLISQGRSGSSGALARLLLAIDRFVVRKAAGVILISSQFAQHYAQTRGLHESVMRVVPNWSSQEGTEESAGAAAAYRARHGIPDGAFLLTYGGNVGAAAGVETIIEAFADSALPDNVHLLVAGNGALLDACRLLASKIAADRVHFDPEWKGSMDPLHAANVLVLSTRGAQSNASVPSKLISYLFAARPVIAMALPGSATQEVIDEARCGVVIPPGDAHRFAESVTNLMAMSVEERSRMGSAGRAWGLTHVTREACLPRVLDLIESAARTS